MDVTAADRGASARNDDQHDDLLGGRWRLGEVLGRGAAADVLDAVDVTSGGAVAVKVLRVDDLGDDGVAVRRFEREAAALTGLDHPGIVRVLGGGRCPDGRPYLVLERADGGSLRDAISAAAVGSGLGSPAAAGIGTELAEALAHAHRRGVVHRDIKPANILVGGDGRAHLTDFGIAAVVGADTLTATGWALGTPAYLAPEQVRGEPVGPPADVYALGLVVLEAATGARAYPGDGLPAALARLERPPSIPESVSPGLAAAVLAMTATAPSSRPTASEAAVWLAAAADAGATMAIPIATTPTTAIPVAAPAADPPVADLPVAGPAAPGPDGGRPWPRAGRLATGPRPPVPPGQRLPFVIAAFTVTFIVLAAVRAFAGGGDPADADAPPPALETSTTVAPAATAATTTTAPPSRDERPDPGPGNGNGNGNGNGRENGNGRGLGPGAGAGDDDEGDD